MHIDPAKINYFTSSISSGYLKSTDGGDPINSAQYWSSATNDPNGTAGRTLADLLKYPFIYMESAASDGISADDAYKILGASILDQFQANNWHQSSIAEGFSNLGIKLASSASVQILPYADIRNFTNHNGDIDESHLYVANLSYADNQFGFPLFESSSDYHPSQGGLPVGLKNNISAAGGSGKHIVVLEKGYFLNPLWDKVLSNNMGGVTHNAGGADEAESPANYSAADKSWTRFGGTYSNSNIYDVYRNTDGTPFLIGLPFELSHSYVTGSSVLSNKAMLKNAIYPDTIDIAAVITADNDEEGANIGFELNQWLNSSYDDVNITKRISDTVLETGLSNAQQTAFKSNFGTRAYTGVRFHFNHFTRLQFGQGTIRMGTLSGSFGEGSVLKISGSGAISSSNYFQKPDGTVTGSRVSFLGGKISGSDMSITANEFDFKTEFGSIKGDSTTFEISSSLLNLTPKSLNVKGQIQAEQVYGQDTFLAGKIVNTGVTNPTFTTVKYDFPFVEVYSKNSSDARLATGSFLLKSNGRTTSFLDNTSQTIVGNHQSFTLSSGLHSTPQYLVSKTNDGVGYPAEFKSWKNISGVDSDYVFVNNTSAINAAQASASLSSNLIGNQLVLNHATGSRLLFNSSSNAFNSITTNTINLYDVLRDDREDVHLQFGIRGTAHPSTGSFNGFNPEYKVEVLDTSGSAVVWEKTYKDTKATHKNWVVFDVPMTDIATFYKQNIAYNSSTGSFDEGSYLGNELDGVKVKISMRYSGSNLMTQRLTEGNRFGTKSITFS